MSIPYGKPNVSSEDIAEVNKVLKSGWLSTGPKVEEFEKKFSEYVNSEYAIAVNSGTAALELAVQALDLKEGDEVITTPLTFMATTNAILYSGGNPVYADISKDTYNINPEEIKKKITNKTKAIICVDYAGHPCDLNEIKKIAKENNLILIEDAAHSIGGEYKREKIGSIADITTFSFHPVKNMTTGEGGMITTNNKEIKEKISLLRNHGMNKNDKLFENKPSWAYNTNRLGRNFRLTDFQCALGISQLKRLDDFVKRKSEVVEKYNQAFINNPKIKIPEVKENIKHAWHIYPCLIENRDKVIQELNNQGIGANVLYIPTYHFTYHQKRLNINKEEYPVTEEVFKKLIALPLFSSITDEEVNKVIEKVNKITNHES